MTRAPWPAVLVLAVCALGPAGAEMATVRVTADRPVYAPGEPIGLTLHLVNGSDRPLTLTFRTAQRFDFLLRDPQGREVWRWAAGRVFAQVLGRETIRPGGALVYTATVNTPLPAGVYTATGRVVAREGDLSGSAAVGVEAR